MVVLFDQKTAVEQYGERKLHEGREKGRAEGVVGTLAELVRDGILSIQEAARRAGITEAAFEEKMVERGI